MDGVWGAYYTPFVRVQTAPKLEDAGIRVKLHFPQTSN